MNENEMCMCVGCFVQVMCFAVGYVFVGMGFVVAQHDTGHHCLVHTQEGATDCCLDGEKRAIEKV